MSFVPASMAPLGGSVPRHSTEDTHLPGDTKPLLSTCHQTVTACPVPGNPTGQPLLHCGVPHRPLQGRAFLPFTPPHWKRLSKSQGPLPSVPNYKTAGGRRKRVFLCVRAQHGARPQGAQSFGLTRTLENRVVWVQPSRPGAETAPSPCASQGKRPERQAPRQGQ